MSNDNVNLEGMTPGGDNLESVLRRKISEIEGSPEVSPKKEPEEILSGEENLDSENVGDEEELLNNAENEPAKEKPAITVEELQEIKRNMDKHFTQISQKYSESKKEVEELKKQYMSALQSLAAGKTQQQVPRAPLTDDDYLRMYEEKYGRFDEFALPNEKRAAIVAMKQEINLDQRYRGLEGMLSTLAANQHQSRYDSLTANLNLDPENKKKHEMSVYAFMKAWQVPMEQAINMVPVPGNIKPVVDEVADEKGNGDKKGKDRIIQELKDAGIWEEVKSFAVGEQVDAIRKKRGGLPPVSSSSGESVPLPQKEDKKEYDPIQPKEPQVVKRFEEALKQDLAKLMKR